MRRDARQYPVSTWPGAPEPIALAHQSEASTPTRSSARGSQCLREERGYRQRHTALSWRNERRWKPASAHIENGGTARGRQEAPVCGGPL